MYLVSYKMEHSCITVKNLFCKMCVWVMLICLCVCVCVSFSFCSVLWFLSPGGRERLILWSPFAQFVLITAVSLFFLFFFFSFVFGINKIMVYYVCIMSQMSCKYWSFLSLFFFLGGWGGNSYILCLVWNKVQILASCINCSIFPKDIERNSRIVWMFVPPAVPGVSVSVF